MNQEQKVALLQVIDDNFHILKNRFQTLFGMFSFFSLGKTKERKALADVLALLQLLARQIQHLEVEIGQEGVLSQELQHQRVLLVSSIRMKDQAGLKRACDDIILALALFVNECSKRLNATIKTSGEAQAA